VIGGKESEAVEGLARLYSFTSAPVIKTDPRTAELTKLAANAALAVRVSMANELARVARCAEANLEALLDGVGSDPRIGRDYLNPGLGFGGSCLPKDLAAFRSSAQQAGMATPVFDGASTTNDYVVESLAEEATVLVSGRPHQRICVIGVGFKPGSDSLRSSQPVRLVRCLLDKGFEVTVYDPIAEQNARREFSSEPRVSYSNSLDEAVNQCDAVIAVDRGLLNGNVPFTEEKAVIDAIGRQIFPTLR
jgi:UDPglucose 6-dehydrogenase